MVSITNAAGLVLDFDGNLVTEQNVAWLTDDELPGEFSYPIDAPLTDNNKRFVSHGYQPDSAQPVNEIPVSVSLENSFYRLCTFAFRVNSGKLSGYLKLDSSEFYDKIRKLSLLEALPDKLFLLDGLVSGVAKNLSVRIKEIANLPAGEFPCTFFPIRNETMLEDDFSSEILPGFVRNAYVNAWEKLPDGSYGFPQDTPLKSGYLICPQFYLSYVLTEIIKRAGYSIESDWLADPETKLLTIKNLTAMSMAVTDLGDLIEGHKLIPGLFLPDMSVGDFLKAIKGRYSLVFSYNSNNRVCTITQFKKTVLAGPAIDLTPYQVGKYSTNDKFGKGYKVTEFYDPNDELYKDAEGNRIEPVPFITGKGGNGLQLKAGTCQLSYEKSAISENGYWFVPIVKQAGNVLDPRYKQATSNYLSEEGKRQNSVGLSILSYRGITTDSKGFSYPLATPDVRDGSQVIRGSEAQGLSGINGAWNKTLRLFYYFRDQTQPITQELELPASIFTNLSLYRTIQLSLEDYVKRSYLIQKVQAQTPGRDGLISVRLDVLSIPPGIELEKNTQNAPVWVELILGKVGDATAPVGYIGVVPIFEHTQTVTVKCWQDPGRQTPALVTNLPVYLRQRTPAYEDVAASEFASSYLVNGSATLVLPGFVAIRSIARVNPTTYYRTIQIDPGEGYNILL